MINLDVSNLQTDSLALLNQINLLLNRYGKSSEKYHNYQQQITHQLQLVKDLELRMTIVAPMKAGKSTIINAIAGQELVPSHSAAMTTLPTELVFNTQLTAPVLTLSPVLVTEYQTMIQQLQDVMETQGTQWIQTQMKEYPHLKPLLEKIATGIAINPQTVGQPAIIETLAILNHLIRLATLLMPDRQPLSLTELPRIETPLRQLPDLATLQSNLVLVDTPGPNEAGENLRLKAVVEEQLQKSSIILIVLNFTALNTEADEAVKREVEKVVQLRGKDNLYVLVNWIDQRKPDGMTSEEVQAFVTAKFDIETTDRIFETSAVKAFLATNFLQALQPSSELPLPQMKMARLIAEQTLGIDWQEELQRISVDQLKAKAEKLWLTSGFAPFLEKAIKNLMLEGSHRCLRNALEMGQNCLMELKEELRLQRSVN